MVNWRKFIDFTYIEKRLSNLTDAFVCIATSPGKPCPKMPENNFFNYQPLHTANFVFRLQEKKKREKYQELPSTHTQKKERDKIWKLIESVKGKILELLMRCLCLYTHSWAMKTFFYHNFSQELLFPVAAEQMSQTKVWLLFPINLSISTSYYLLWFEPRKKIKK